MKIYMFAFCASLLLFSCKSNKSINEGAELNLDDQSEVKVQRPAGSILKVDKIIEAVDMNENQSAKFRDIYYAYQDKRMDIRKAGGKPNQMLKEVLKMRDDQNKEVKKFLNDEQYERYLIAINDKKNRPKLGKPAAPKM